MAKKITVYIGRFQPLHLGHTYVLKQALDTSDLVIVLIGSAFQARTIKNPFTFAERANMIKDWMAKEYDRRYFDGSVPTIILPLRDQPYNNAKWIQSVQEMVEQAILEKDWQNHEVEIHLTGSDRDPSTWYLSAFPQYRSELKPAIPPGKDLSATMLRHRLFSNDDVMNARWDDVPPSTFKFLESFMNTDAYSALTDEYDFLEDYKRGWAKAPYRPTFVTVDAVVVQSGHILVVERGALPGKGLWALPGGFVNEKERLEDAVIRELIEETGIKIQPQVLKGSIRAKEIFDDPDRSLRGRTITTAFLIRLDDTKPLPKVKGQNMPLHESGGKPVVETAKAFWLPINEARSQSARWFEDHHAVNDTMLGLIKD